MPRGTGAAVLWTNGHGRGRTVGRAFGPAVSQSSAAPPIWTRRLKMIRNGSMAIDQPSAGCFFNVFSKKARGDPNVGQTYFFFRYKWTIHLIKNSVEYQNNELII